MEEKPLISIIVPVYRVEDYLDRCLRSLTEQTYDNLEIILVEDGSPDASGAICDRWAENDPRIHVIHKENGGLSDARNTGIDYALQNTESHWLAFVDSDDWVERTFIEQLHRAACENGCKLSVCGYYQTSGQGNAEQMDYRCEVMGAEDFYCELDLDRGFPCVAWNKLYHRSLFATLRFPVGKLHEDEFTTYQAVFEAGNVAVVSAKLYAYYQNDAGIMRSKWSPRRLDALEAYQGQIAYAQNNGYLQLRRMARQNYVYSIFQQLEQNRKMPESAIYRKQLKRDLYAGLRDGIQTGECSLLWIIRSIYDTSWVLSPFRGGISKMRRSLREKA